MENNRLIGKYVEFKEYCKEMEGKGFKYSSLTKSFFLSYPFIPREFMAQAVRVVLETSPISPVAKISSVEYMRRGSPFKHDDDPGDAFKGIIEPKLQDSVEAAKPRNFIVG
jgi:hypothetical protein